MAKTDESVNGNYAKWRKPTERGKMGERCYKPLTMALRDTVEF